MIDVSDLALAYSRAGNTVTVQEVKEFGERISKLGSAVAPVVVLATRGDAPPVQSEVSRMELDQLLVVRGTHPQTWKDDCRSDLELEAWPEPLLLENFCRNDVRRLQLKVRKLLAQARLPKGSHHRAQSRIRTLEA